MNPVTQHTVLISWRQFECVASKFGITCGSQVSALYFADKSGTNSAAAEGLKGWMN